MEEFTVDVELLGLSSDGVCFERRNAVRNGAGEVTATGTSEGVGFDLKSRRPRPPPANLDRVMREMPRADTHGDLPSRRPASPP